MAAAAAAGALRVGANLAAKFNSFRKGVSSTASSVKNTAAEIRQKQKLITGERRRQDQFEKQVQEEVERREKEKELEAGGTALVSPVQSLVRNFVQKPFEALMKLVVGWAIMNLPRLLREVTIFTKKVRVFAAAMKKAITSVGGVFSSLVKITSAFIKNISEFDFTDRSGRIKNATDDLDDSLNEIGASVGEMKNVWEREEQELDMMLYSLDYDSSIQEAIDSTIRANMLGVEGEVTPTAPAFGPGAYDGLDTKATAAAGQWSPVLNMIASAESVGGSYDSAFPGEIIDGLSEMTIAEVDALQAKRARAKGSGAVGRYQFMNVKEQAAAAGIPDYEIFSPSNQDKMAIALIEKKRGISMKMLKDDPTEAAKRLSMEWAGLPVLEATQGASGTVQAGQSYFAGDGMNAANVSPEQVQGSFMQATGEMPMAGPAPSMTTGVVDEANVSQDKHAKVGVTSRYGRRSSPGGVGSTNHKGIDIGTSGQRGYLVAFKSSGRVARVGRDPGGYGNFVIIECPGMGMSFMFAHLARVFVKGGQDYNGQAIGEIGNTGASTGIHLHFEAYIGGAEGRDINPEPYIGYLSIGRRTKALVDPKKVETAADPKAEAQETATTVAKKKTTGTRVHKDTTIIKETQVVKQ